jgi:hypothetical protein
VSNRPADEIPVWRETPLDHWSAEIDPAIMSGDEWVDSEDPGMQRIRELQGGTYGGERFMHPMHDTNYGLEDDRFSSDTFHESQN